MSKWLSAEEVDALIAEYPDCDRLMLVYGLSQFTTHAFYSRNYEPPELWERAVVLTEQGQEYLERMRSSNIVMPPHIAHFTLFRIFYHHDLLINHQMTDVDLITQLLSELHHSRGAVWPYAFGNRLYHKFNDTYAENKTDYMEPDSVSSLLQDTPQGVYQIGSLLSGPLGFLQSSERRVFPPTLSLVLWHCSDPGCRHRHYVELKQYDNSIKKARDTVVRYILDNLGPPSEWKLPILRHYRKSKWPAGRPFSDLPAVIGDCVLKEERAQLLLRAFKSHHNTHLVESLQVCRGLHGSPEQLLQATSAEEQHQLLLLLPDADLIGYLDELVAAKQIRIPVAELRRARTYRYGHSSDRSSDLSSLGLRSPGHSPLVELAANLCRTYESLHLLDDLGWRVRGHGGSTLSHQVFDFLRIHGPEAVARELILPSRAVTQALAEEITFSIYNEEEESVTVRRLLWKFGFNPPRYEEEYALLRERITQFTKCVLELPPTISEGDRARVRGIGVNLFVSIEQFLEDFLSYNVWMMSSDHFLITIFSYNRQEAVEVVPVVLGEKFESGPETVTWNTGGRNTLGGLLSYIDAFAKWIAERVVADRSALARSDEDYPHYRDDTLLIFPFRHKALWADCAKEMLANYADTVQKIAVQLAQADLASVRNGLDHKRDEMAFPTSDKLIACSSRLQKIVDIADSKRLIPKLYWGVAAEHDNAGNICDTFHDYLGNRLCLMDPGVCSGVLQRQFGVPYLIAPYDFLNQPNSLLIFTVSPSSPYREYWQKYPRRRFIPYEQRNGDEKFVAEEIEQDAPVDRVQPGTTQTAVPD